jgi:hypothetical protein
MLPLLLAVPSLAALPAILIYVLVIGIALAVIYWIITTFFPAPLQRYAVGALMVIAAIFIIYLLLGLLGGGRL